MALKEQEKLFAREYIKNSMKPHLAALAAGYKESTSKYAYEWLEKSLKNSTEKRHLPYKPELAQYIAELVEQMEEEQIADGKEVLKYLTSVMRKESVASVLARNELGADEVMVKPPDEKEALKAAELLGKAHMLFTEKVEQQIDMDLNITVDYGDAE